MSDQMHPKVKPFSESIARSLGIEEAFIQFVTNDSKPECFEFYISDAEHGWTTNVSSEVDEAFPVWSTSADQTLLCVNKRSYWFAKGSHEGDDMYAISQTAQGLLAKVFINLIESEETELALKEGSKASGFRFLEQTVKWVYEDIVDNYTEAQDKFIEHIDELAITPIGELERKQLEAYLFIDPDEEQKRQIPQEIIQRLENQKLIVTEALSLSDAHYPCGRHLFKPKVAGGNTLPFEKRMVNGIECDAPRTTLFWEDNGWTVAILLSQGENPYPRAFPAVEDAAKYIDDFYFGNPDEMNQFNQSPYESRQAAQKEIVKLAQDMLDQTIGLGEGIYQLENMEQYLLEENQKRLLEPIHNRARAYEKFPMGDARKLWSADYLTSLDIEREKLENEHREKVELALKRIIHVLGG